MSPRSYLSLSKDEREHALALHKDNVVIDSSVVAVIDYVAENMWLDDMFKGGLTVTNLTVCMRKNFSEALKELIEYNHWAQKFKDHVLLVKKSDDILAAKKQGKHGVIFGPQDSSFLERNIDFLKIAYDHGLRIMQLTYNWQNDVGGGCREKNDVGLSIFGENLVKEMNKTGILIDLSHTGDKTCRRQDQQAGSGQRAEDVRNPLHEFIPVVFCSVAIVRLLIRRPRRGVMMRRFPPAVTLFFAGSTAVHAEWFARETVVGMALTP